MQESFTPGPRDKALADSDTPLLHDAQSETRSFSSQLKLARLSLLLSQLFRFGLLRNFNVTVN